jgi:hypothetical protein
MIMSVRSPDIGAKAIRERPGAAVADLGCLSDHRAQIAPPPRPLPPNLRGRNSRPKLS